MKELTHLSLFSGIGGLDLAAEWAGFRTVGQCEWADYPRAVLEKHWPGLPRWRDIRTLTKESFYEQTGLHTVDVISGGFPCQPFSVAGKRGGKEDDRYLWPEMLRVIRELQPTWVIGENVPGIVNLALDTVLSDLEAEGYEIQCFLVPACGVDAPHKRQRVAIVAHSLCERNGKHRTSDDAPEAGGYGHHEFGRETENGNGKRRSNQSGMGRMADRLRTAIHKTDPDTESIGLEGSCAEPLLVSDFTICSSRERERPIEYDGLSGNIVNQVAVKMVEKYDGFIADQIAMEARASGVSDVTILNKEAIMNALKKEIPQQVILNDIECLCPACRYDMMGLWDYPDVQDPNYCPICGQKLKWRTNDGR